MVVRPLLSKPNAHCQPPPKRPISRLGEQWRYVTSNRPRRHFRTVSYNPFVALL